MPEFVFYEDDEADILLDSEAESVGVVHVYGEAVYEIEDWLEQWYAASAMGAPEWSWILHPGSGAATLRLARYSEDADDWIVVFEVVPSEWEDVLEAGSGKQMMQDVFGGYVPSQKKKVRPGSF